MLLIWKTVCDPSSESCRNICIRRVWMWWDDILPHESLAQYVTEIRGGKVRERKKAKDRQHKMTPLKETKAGCGNSELPSSQMISTDTGGKCWSRIDFFFPTAVIMMLFKYACMCDAEVQLLNAWKPFGCIFLLFSPRVAMESCVYIPVPEGLQFDGRSVTLGRGCNRCGAFPKVQSQYGRADSCKIISVCFSKMPAPVMLDSTAAISGDHDGPIPDQYTSVFGGLGHIFTSSLMSKSVEAMWLTTTAAAKAL